MPDQNTNRALSEAALAMPLFSLNSRNLSASDIGIANYIAGNPAEVQTLTISELAARTEVSETTISRFCRKIGLNGVQSLKLALAGSQAGADADIATGKITKSDDCRSLMKKVFSNIVRGLESTEEVLDPDAVEKAAQMIAGTSRLLVFGFGTSGTICRDIAIRFVRFGMSTELITDAHQQGTVAGALDGRAVVFVVSNSGSSVDLIRSARMAKERGAKIILLTAHRQSPLSKLADVVLMGTGPEMAHFGESTNVRLVFLAIIDVLYARLSLLLEDKYRRNLQGMREAMAELKC
jgi:RpiR family carbohydrate utilization transcriptional regulator